MRDLSQKEKRKRQCHKWPDGVWNFLHSKLSHPQVPDTVLGKLSRICLLTSHSTSPMIQWKVISVVHNYDPESPEIADLTYNSDCGLFSFFNIWYRPFRWVTVFNFKTAFWVLSSSLRQRTMMKCSIKVKCYRAVCNLTPTEAWHGNFIA